MRSCAPYSFRTTCARARQLTYTYAEGPDPNPHWKEERWGSEDAWEEGDALIELTDTNFEHDTQAATGATTGDWFISFYAPWCSSCKAIAKEIVQTARELKGEVNVAQINAFKYQSTSNRFKLEHYPTLLFFRHGKYCAYTGPRTWSDFAAFCRHRYEHKCDGQWVDVPPVPEPLNASEPVFEQVQGYANRLYQAFAKNPRLAFISVVIGLVIGLIPLYLVYVYDNDTIVYYPETGEIKSKTRVIMGPRKRTAEADNKQTNGNQTPEPRRLETIQETDVLESAPSTLESAEAKEEQGTATEPVANSDESEIKQRSKKQKKKSKT